MIRQETVDRIIKFTTDRNWDQFHSPANLAKSISIEANELLECFQWNDDGYKLDDVKEERERHRMHPLHEMCHKLPQECPLWSVAGSP